MNRRWLRVGLLGGVLLAVNLIARLVTVIADVTEPSTLDLIAYVGIGVVFLILIGAGAWWAVRFPFSRLFFDIGAAVVAVALLALFIGPLIGGESPFSAGLASMVAQFLLFLGLGFLGGLLGFAAVVTVGKDWKSRGLRQYEESYHRRPNRATRG